jgi:hypothetical protein
MEKINELLENVCKYFVGLGIFIIPGVFVLEIVFKTGFFSNRIITTIDLIFYIFWGLIFSLPFHFTQPKIFRQYIKSKMKKSLNMDDESLEELSNDIEFEFVIFKTIVFYFVYNMLIWHNWLQIPTILFITPRIFCLFIAILISIITGYMSIYLLKKIKIF